MGHLAFFSFPSVGHILPMLGVVDQLTARGHRVTFVIDERFAGQLDDCAAEPLRYHSDFPDEVHPVDTAHDAITMVMDLLLEGFAPLSGALARFAGDRPDVIVHDYNQAYTARILARAWGIPLVQASPTFALNDDGEMPGAPEVPADHPAAVSDPDDRRLVDLGDRLGPRIAEVLGAYGIDPEIAGTCLKGGDERLQLVFLPRAFHFGAETFGDRYSFVGPVRRAAAPEETWRPPADGRPVVLVTASTALGVQADAWSDLAAAFGAGPWHTVFAGGHPLEPGHLQSNVEYHRWLWLPAVLPHVSAVVCEAGTGTLLEALRHAVPVVALPRTQEQKTAAVLLEELGVGTAVQPEDANGAAVVAAVAAVIDDAPMRVRLATMSGAIERSGGEIRAADDLEALLP